MRRQKRIQMLEYLAREEAARWRRLEVGLVTDEDNGVVSITVPGRSAPRSGVGQLFPELYPGSTAIFMTSGKGDMPEAMGFSAWA